MSSRPEADRARAMAFQGTAEITDSEASGTIPVRIEAFEGPGKGTTALLSNSILTLGSDPTCELVLADPTVSRRHCTVESAMGSVVVHDLGSRNGLRYLGAKVREVRLPIGSELTVGKTKVRFLAVASREVEEADPPPGLVGRSHVMRALFAQMYRLASADGAVLFEGETGTGKEVMARALHTLSPRSSGPMVVFDCASANSALIESDLFGHLKGAFSGATHDRSGVFEHAAGGTLLLDAIDELPLSLQPKLLRVLDAKEFKPVGGHNLIPIRCSVFASSSKNLQAEIEAKKFRSDLYFRISMATLRVPPLRERAEDIPELVKHFVSTTAGIDVALAPATLAAFQCKRWPGNVRELRSAVQTALTLGETLGTVSQKNAEGLSYATARDEMMQRFERDYLVALLEANNRDVNAAAKAAKLSRRQLYRLLARHGLVRRGAK
jgi:DNA-binding NtrC family response regulator